MDLTSNDQDCLCLLCRKTGHVLQNCPDYERYWSTKSSASDHKSAHSSVPNPPFKPLPVPEGSIQAMCQRCNQLKALTKIASHRPIVREDLESAEDQWEFNRVHKKTTQIPPLGPVLSLRLLSTCPLCRLIFDATTLTDEEMEMVGGELVLVTGWMIHRFEPDLYWKGYGKGEGPYARCLYMTTTSQLRPIDYCQPRGPAYEAIEAIGVIDIEEGEQDDAHVLGVRQVNPKTPDYDIINGWLSRCVDLHQTTCRPIVSEELKKIKLVDVENRRIVMYPAAGCDYVALSYVWGDVEPLGYKLGDVLPTVPATLEDAMEVTRNLNKQYLWADSLSINQKDSAEKDAQIAVMSAIYMGAWATIVCLSGRSASSGLPRVSTRKDVIPQLSLEIWGKRLLSVMPTLHQQMSWSPWSSRAWTYQEGLLSPRCLFFTNHQVYFECNSVQCCESLDDSGSPFHLQSDDMRRATLDDLVQSEFDFANPVEVIGQGVLRDPFRPISRDAEAQIDSDKFARYLWLVATYTVKEMTHDADSLNAFSGVLARQEEVEYEKGFLHGLPVEDLPRALTWYHLVSPRRRDGFPAWSWAGWDGDVSNRVVHGAEARDHAIMPPLRMWKPGTDGRPELVYNFNPAPYIEEELARPKEDENDSRDETEEEDTDSLEDSDSSVDSESKYEVSIDTDEGSFEGVDFLNDPVFRLAKTMLEIPATLPKIDKNELLIEGIVVRLVRKPADYSSGSDVSGGYWDMWYVPIEGQPEQKLRLYGYNDDEPLSKESGAGQLECLLLSRLGAEDEPGQKIHNALLIIDLDGDVANRAGVASLKLDSAGLLDDCKPERKLFRLK